MIIFSGDSTNTPVRDTGIVVLPLRPQRSTQPLGAPGPFPRGPPFPSTCLIFTFTSCSLPLLIFFLEDVATAAVAACNNFGSKFTTNGD